MSKSCPHDVPTHPPLDRELDGVYTSLPPDSRWRATVGSPEGTPRAPLSLEARRALMDRESLDDETLRRGGRITATEQWIPGPAGAPEIATLILRPAEGVEPWPCIYYLHGSGMTMPGNRTMMKTEQLDWVVDLGLALVSIDYRVAPEDPHPAPVEDAYAGLVWTVENAAALNIDPARIILAGVSAGGGIAAATALLSRDRGGPELTHQLLVCPMLDDREITKSSQFEGVVWDKLANRSGWTALLGESRGGTEVSPYAAPARAEDLTGLPSTYLDAGSAEVFRDEIMDYAARLVEVDVPLELHIWSGAMHGSEAMAPDTEITHAAQAARKSFLRRAIALATG